jgi:hypothetical protein
MIVIVWTAIFANSIKCGDVLDVPKTVWYRASTDKHLPVSPHTQAVKKCESCPTVSVFFPQYRWPIRWRHPIFGDDIPAPTLVERRDNLYLHLEYGGQRVVDNEAFASPSLVLAESEGVHYGWSITILVPSLALC